MCPRKVEISVVIPVYGCADSLGLLYERLLAALEVLTDNFEILFVDDRSQDHAWSMISRFASRDHRIRAYQLSRNFGQHAAITAGLANCRGRWAVVMDCDLQDPPMDIQRLYKKALDGYDIVLARRSRKGQSLFRRVSAWLYFKILGAFSNERIDGRISNFSIISRKVINTFIQVPDRDRHYLLILRWLGYRRATLSYEPGERQSGTSAYNLKTLIQLGLDGLFFQTTVLLRWIVYVGFFVSLLGLLLTGVFVYRYFVYGALLGWTSLVVLILVIGGFILISTGVTGLYIGKIFEQVKGRPLYVISKQIENGLER